MFKIGEFSKISQVSMRALRLYDEIGLFKPQHIEDQSGYRFYSAEQIPRLNRILALKDLGFSLEEIAQMLDKGLAADELRTLLENKRKALKRTVEAEQHRLARIEARLRQIELEGSFPSYDAVLKQIEPQRVLSIREIAPTFVEMGDLLLETYYTIRRNGVRNIEPGVAIFYDPQYEEQQVDWEIAFPVKDHVRGPINLSNGRQMSPGELPGIPLAASVIYRGDYIGLHQGYSALGMWIEANGYQIDGIGREIFLHVEPDADENNITEIMFPVTKIS